jgi:uncharacterized protein YndB with AHSA1/START domain
MNHPDMPPALVRVRREIAATPDEVFDAWLDPEALAEWMRPDSILQTRATLDARVGGRYEILMHRAEDTILHRGEYRVIDRPRRLVFTWISPATEQRESLVTVDFHPRGARTEIVVTHEHLPGDRETIVSHTGGWTQAIDRLAGLHS